MKVFIIGTGNVASALCKAVIDAGHVLTGIAGRDTEQTKRFSKKYKCSTFTFKEIPDKSDFFILAIKDDSIPEVAKMLPTLSGIVSHTSGTVELDILKKFPSRGVFYPVASITANHPRNFKKVPICIEGSDEKSFRLLMSLASSFSNEIYSLNSEQRAALHVAAVFANNFTNHILGIAFNILEKKNLPSELLNSLVLSTVKNTFSKGSYLAQTGPAVRNDEKTIARHLKFLQKNKEYKKLYEIITNQIISVHNKKRKTKNNT